MQDRRIRKTKNLLKNTMIALLNSMTFEKITVTDICKKADISRITFYSHYSDKYALADEVFDDFCTIAKSHFFRLQKENNPNNDSVQNYCNILDCILQLFSTYPAFFQHITPEQNPYLSSLLYHITLKTVENQTRMESHNHQLRYTPRQITGFLCYGLTGFINESRGEGIEEECIHQQAKQLLMDTVRSQVIIE